MCVCFFKFANNAHFSFSNNKCPKDAVFPPTFIGKCCLYVDANMKGRNSLASPATQWMFVLQNAAVL